MGLFPRLGLILEFNCKLSLNGIIPRKRKLSRRKGFMIVWEIWSVSSDDRRTPSFVQYAWENICNTTVIIPVWCLLTQMSKWVHLCILKITSDFHSFYLRKSIEMLVNNWWEISREFLKWHLCFIWLSIRFWEWHEAASAASLTLSAPFIKWSPSPFHWSVKIFSITLWCWMYSA